MKLRRIRPAWLPPAIISIVAFLAVSPFFTGKYVFLLDMTFGPTWDPLTTRAYGFFTPAYGGSLPLFVLLAPFNALAGPTVVQKLLLAGVVVFTAASGYISLPGSRWARLYGALLLLVNPFVFGRLIVGQWAVVWGLAALPLVLKTYSTYLEQGRRRDLVLAVFAITLLGFSAHLLYASVVLIGSLTLFGYLEFDSDEIVRRGVTVASVAAAVNAYWVFPVLLAGGRSLPGVSPADAIAYAPRSDGTSVLHATATMHGFWRGGIAYAIDLFPPVMSLYVVILFLAVYGALATTDDDQEYVVKAVAVTAVVALLLGTGVSGPTGAVNAWLFDTVPFFAGMRDANKFVALIVLAYAYLGALGVEAFRVRLAHDDRRRWATTVVFLLLVFTPVVYSFPMVTGYAGQIHADDYPEEWYEARAVLSSDRGDYSVLFLPWHQYMDYSWVEGRHQRLATPARTFFPREVIQGDNVEMGSVYSASTNPVSHYVEFLFGLEPGAEAPAVSNMGELLAHVNVKYVLLTKEADWKYYDEILSEQRDLSLVREDEFFKIYRNEHRLDRGYAVDRVTYVRSLSHFVELSQQRDTDGVYAVDESRTRRTVPPDPDERARLQVDKRSPVRYRIHGTSREYTVFLQSQRVPGRGWRYDGEPPTHRHLGIHPVFESAPDGATARFGPFYRLYLPSYAVSVLACLGLLLYWRSRRIDRLVQQWKRGRT